MQLIYDRNNIAVNNIIIVFCHQCRIAIKTTQMKRETIQVILRSYLRAFVFTYLQWRNFKDYMVYLDCLVIFIDCKYQKSRIHGPHVLFNFQVAGTDNIIIISSSKNFKLLQIFQDRYHYTCIVLYEFRTHFDIL